MRNHVLCGCRFRPWQLSSSWHEITVPWNSPHIWRSVQPWFKGLMWDQLIFPKEKNICHKHLLSTLQDKFDEYIKWCGMVTSFCEVRVDARSANGMPNSETIIEQLTCRVLGDLVQEGKGVVTKLADDLYCDGSTPEDLNNLTRTLQASHQMILSYLHKKQLSLKKFRMDLVWWYPSCKPSSNSCISQLSTPI